MSKKDVLVVGAMRSIIGSGRSDSHLLGLTMQVLGAMFCRVIIPRSEVRSFKLGSVVSLKSASITQAPAKEIALLSHIPNASSNIAEKACSSGLRAIHEAEMSVRYEDCGFAVGAGVDLMSGASAEINDGALRDPITKKSMAELSDEKARELGFSKDDYDLYALESFTRAKKHLEHYWDANYLTQIYVPGKGLSPHIDQNVTYREVTAESMAKMRKISGCEITTFTSASKLGDGCGALTLASPGSAKKRHRSPLAKILGYAEHAEKESKDFICAPVGAVQEALEIAKLPLSKIGSFWINEAFPSPPFYFMRTLNIPWEIVNPWGGAIAFGHPLGATGAILCVNAICQARKEGKKYVVVSVCNAIGEATAMVFEIM